VTVVLDASVVLKWLLADTAREENTDKATQVMERVAAGRLEALEPAHWLAEVAAVLARESPHTAVGDVALLSALEIPVSDDPLVLRRATELAIELKQHVFDTLYHAIALETPDAILVTADTRYLRAARGKGRIADLADWE
jgi:predicted nucleic acid-binding protein